MKAFSSLVVILFLSIHLQAEASEDEAALHNRERLAGIEAYKAERAQAEASAERARRNYVQSQKNKKNKDREASPEFRQWTQEREKQRLQREAIRKREAERSRPGLRDRDAQIVVPQSERIDHQNRGLFNSSKLIVPKGQRTGSGTSSSGSSAGFGGMPDFAPPPPPPPPSYGNTFAPPAPDIYEPDPNGFDSQMQMGDEIPPPIFDEADF